MALYKIITTTTSRFLERERKKDAGPAQLPSLPILKLFSDPHLYYHSSVTSCFYLLPLVCFEPAESICSVANLAELAGNGQQKSQLDDFIPINLQGYKKYFFFNHWVILLLYINGVISILYITSQ